MVGNHQVVQPQIQHVTVQLNNLQFARVEYNLWEPIIQIPCPIQGVYPLVIKRGNGKSSQNCGFIAKTIQKWEIFHCHTASIPRQSTRFCWLNAPSMNPILGIQPSQTRSPTKGQPRLAMWALIWCIPWKIMANHPSRWIYDVTFLGIPWNSG